jgi:hypothetical protein
MLNLFATSEKHKQPEIGYCIKPTTSTQKKPQKKIRFTAAERRILSPVLKEMQSLFVLNLLQHFPVCRLFVFSQVAK